MVEVELVDDEPPPSGPDPVTEWLRRARAAGARAAARVGLRVARAWRRPWVRWVSGVVAVALVAVPVVVHQADAAHARARFAALAEVPGIVRPLHPGLKALMSVDDPDAQVLTEGFVAGDSLVSVVQPSNGDWSIVGLDAATGARRWSTRLEPVGAPGDQVVFPACDAVGAVVLCSGTQVADQASFDWETATWVLDPADGHVIRSAAYDEHTDAVAAGGLIVMARQSSGPLHAPAAGPWTVTWQVTGSDPSTGEVRWTWTSPPVPVAAVLEDQNFLHDPADYYSLFRGASRRSPSTDVALDVGDNAWVLGPDGSELTHIARPGGWSVWEEGGSLVRSPVLQDAGSAVDQPANELLVDDGSWRPLTGSDPWLTLNDGSAPDVLLRVSSAASGGQLLSGVDRHTGRTLWQAPLGPAVGFTALLQGRVYVGTQMLQAIDASTGRVIWRTRADDPVGGLVATDGQVLVVRSHDSANRVEARSMRDGRVLWSQDVSAAALPSGERNVAGIGTLQVLGRIAAVRQDQSVVVLG